MKCRIIRMRLEGMAIPKYAFRKQVHWTGELVVMDGRDDNVNRTIKTARLTDTSWAEKRIEILYEPHLVWMNEGRFTLQGFERILKEGKIVEYAQSWFCQAEPNEAPR